jgi:poly-gamma-glutamate synthesis protein (capsule biosynthesis protein)
MILNGYIKNSFIRQFLFLMAVAALLNGCGTYAGEQAPTVSAPAPENTPPVKKEAKESTDAGESSVELTHDEPVNEPSESVTDPVKSRTVRIIMVGDILLHTPVEETARSEDGSYDFSFIFENLRDDISAADVAIVNEEVIIGGEELGVSGYPLFNAPCEIADALADTGFDVVCHATNHALDRGDKGIVNTLSYWRSHYPEITVTGISDSGNDQDNDEIPIIESNGIKIAVLNYTYGTNGMPAPKDMPDAIDMLKEDKVISDLRLAEEQADFTIVCPHWGTEYNTGTDAYQTYWTGVFKDNGADLILGTHPHVIEPIVLFEDDNAGISNNHGGGDMLVYYSLGNFVNWTSGRGKGISNRMVGGMADVTIGEDAGEICIKDYSVKALVCHVENKHKGVTVYPLSEYTLSLEEKNEIADQDSSFSRDHCVDLCDEVWGSLWE